MFFSTEKNIFSTAEMFFSTEKKLVPQKKSFFQQKTYFSTGEMIFSKPFYEFYFQFNISGNPLIVAQTFVFLSVHRHRCRFDCRASFADSKFEPSRRQRCASFVTADFEISSTNDFSPTDIQKIEEIISKSTIIEARNEAITTSAMARPVDEANQTFVFVELKGIEPPFPLVGNFTLSGGKPFDFKLLGKSRRGRRADFARRFSS